ncbi:asparaginase [Streptomyces sp. HUAS ZL42]|uniref:asparaginase n=1 Tax=Streptomyces sp. HUAS ZL42 TaxID=3231715 RepID=UPI00345E1872
MTPPEGTAAARGHHRAAPPVLAEAVRSGFVEGRHRGQPGAAGRGQAGRARARGRDVPVFPRSSNRPMQAAGVLRAVLDLTGERPAPAAASLPRSRRSPSPPRPGPQDARRALAGAKGQSPWRRDGRGGGARKIPATPPRRRPTVTS